MGGEGTRGRDMDRLWIELVGGLFEKHKERRGRVRVRRMCAHGSRNMLHNRGVIRR